MSCLNRGYLNNSPEIYQVETKDILIVVLVSDWVEIEDIKKVVSLSVELEQRIS